MKFCNPRCAVVQAGNGWLTFNRTHVFVFVFVFVREIARSLQVHAVRCALLMCLQLTAPTSTHGVFTSFSYSQYCCSSCIFEKNKFGSLLAQGVLRVKGQAQITKYYLLWVDAINMQSLSGHYLLRQQVPNGVFTSLVYLGAVAYISVEIRLGSCWCRDILRVKGQALITNCNFLWLCVICIIEW